MYNPPVAFPLFENCRAQAAAIDVALLAVLRYISRDSVFESGPGSLARQMNLDIAERVLGVLHLTHFGKEMVVAIIGPAVVSVPTLEHCQ